MVSFALISMVKQGSHLGFTPPVWWVWKVTVEVKVNIKIKMLYSTALYEYYSKNYEYICNNLFSNYDKISHLWSKIQLNRLEFILPISRRSHAYPILWYCNQCACTYWCYQTVMSRQSACAELTRKFKFFFSFLCHEQFQVALCRSEAICQGN